MRRLRVIGFLLLSLHRLVQGFPMLCAVLRWRTKLLYGPIPMLTNVQIQKLHVLDANLFFCLNFGLVALDE